MALIVETGTGASNANGYITEAFYDAYVEDGGLTNPVGDTEAAIVRASAAFDAIYGPQLGGVKVNRRAQAMALPRYNMMDAAGEIVEFDSIPIEVKKAVAEMTVREKASPGSMTPDLERGGAIESIQAGSVSIKYRGDAAAQTVFQKIDGILAPLLGGGGASEIPLTGMVVRR